MPGTLHELFLEEVKMDIQGQLVKIRENSNSIADLVHHIKSQGSSPMILQNGNVYNPDIRFGHPDFFYPGVVIEIAYSQSRKDLDSLAERYIVQSGGAIKVVIGLELEYRKGRKAVLSIWRPKHEEEGGKPHVTARKTISEVSEVKKPTLTGLRLRLCTKGKK